VCFDQQTGFLVAPGDLAKLRDRMLRLAADANLRRQLGQAGRAFVEQNFAVEKMTREIFALYQRLLANRANPAN
jgi:glycosyltransferase involved in cell wall biosynthesis